MGSTNAYSSHTSGALRGRVPFAGIRTPPLVGEVRDGRCLLGSRL